RLCFYAAMSTSERGRADGPTLATERKARSLPGIERVFPVTVNVARDRPINNRPGAHVKEAGDFVCRVDRFVRHLGFICHAALTAYKCIGAGEHVQCPARRRAPPPSTELHLFTK